MDINIFVGQKIKEFRNKKNITQQELADYLETTSQTVSRYESGILETNNRILFKLAEYFDVNVDDFFPQLSDESINKEQLQEIDDNRFPNLKDAHFKLKDGFTMQDMTDEQKAYLDLLISNIKKDIDKELDNKE